jgi:hypothetical protein
MHRPPPSSSSTVPSAGAPPAAPELDEHTPKCIDRENQANAVAQRARDKQTGARARTTLAALGRSALDLRAHSHERPRAPHPTSTLAQHRSGTHAQTRTSHGTWNRQDTACACTNTQTHSHAYTHTDTLARTRTCRILTAATGAGAGSPPPSDSSSAFVSSGFSP